MTQRPATLPSVVPDLSVPAPGCAHCGIRRADRCALMAPEGDFDLAGASVDVRARRPIADPSGEDASVFVVCAGLACRSRVRRGGGRQILAYLMPGEIASVHSIFAPHHVDALHAVTDIKCMAFPRKDVLRQLECRTDLMRRVIRFSAEGVAQIEDLLVDLGRCTGVERMARFFAKFARRMYARGWNPLQPIPFPIRQNLLADTLGLTTTHVGRILGQLRRERIMEVRDGCIALLDIGRLGLLADLKVDPEARPPHRSPSFEKGFVQ